MSLSFLKLFVVLPQFISGSNLALTSDAANSTCTAACSTYSDTSNTDTTTSNSNTVSLKEPLNTTRNDDQGIKELNGKMDDLIASLSHIKDATITNAGAINDILLLLEDLLTLHNESSSASSPLPTSCQEIRNKHSNSPSGVYLLTTAKNGTKIFTVIWMSCVVQEEDGQD